MKLSTVEDVVFPGCPIRNVLVRICDKWALLVLYALNRADGPVRFKELQRSIPDISQKMLTVTLRSLEDDGYVSRKAYAEVPPRVEYELTALAHSLIPCFNALLGWAVDHLDVVKSNRTKLPGS